MKSFRILKNGSLDALLNTARRDGYFEQGFVDVSEYFTVSKDKPNLKSNDNKYTSLLLLGYDGEKRYIGKENENWVLYDILG